MRRTFGALIAAGALVALLAGTTSAASPKQAGTTSFVTSACIDTQDEMIFRVDWANQTIDQSQLLTVIWTLDGRGLPSAEVFSVYAPTFDETSYADNADNPTAVIVGPNGPIAWDSWRTIGASASGAFNATAKVIHRPGHSWPAC
jgi:hypothetical protein